MKRQITDAERAALRTKHDYPFDETDPRITVNEKTGCWDWQRATDRDGYGSTGAWGTTTKQWRAHRAFKAMADGWVAPDKVIDHICRNRTCVNPAHLRWVTHRENILAGQGLTAKNALKSTCPTCGGPYTIEYDTRGGRKRRCRACQRNPATRRGRRPGRTYTDTNQQNLWDALHALPHE